MRSYSGFRRVQRADHWPCRYCKVEICIDELDRNSGGKCIPLNYSDKSRHKCKSPENPWNQYASGRGWN